MNYKYRGDRICPICQSSSDLAHIHRFIIKDNKGYVIIRCNNCQFIYVSNPDHTTISNTANHYIPKPKRRHFQIKNLLDTYRPFQSRQNINVLEIGSGYGNLPLVLGNTKKYNYIGFEPNPERAKVCWKRNLNVKAEYFSPQVIQESIDVIVIDNVLEHVYEPKTLLKDTASVLRKKGLLIIIVPNLYDIRQINTYWMNRHLWQPHCHINYFTGNQLKYLFKEQNLTFSVFGLETLELKRDFLNVPKVLFDKLGLYLLGLYCYGIKV